MEGEKEQNNIEPAPRISDISGRPPITPMDLPKEKPAVSSPTKITQATKEKEEEETQEPLVVSTGSRGSSNNWVWWVIGIFGLLLVAGTIYYFLSQISFNRATVSFSFSPSGANLELDGKDKGLINSISLRVKSGEHNFKATKEGYLTWEENFVLVAGEEVSFNIDLKPVPTASVLFEGSTKYMDLIRKDELLVYYDTQTGGFSAYNLEDSEIVPLFNENYSFPTLEKVSWSPSGVSAVVKIRDTWRINNMFDNSQVKGMYVPLGGSPEQAPELKNGVATWLFDNERQNTKGIQPVLMNGSIRDITFSPGGDEILYYYEAANGERSLIRAAEISGGEWSRLITDLSGKNPKLIWLQDDNYILFYDDEDYVDQIYSILDRGFLGEGSLTDRVFDTKVVDSPDGSKLLYAYNSTNGVRLGIWDVLENKLIQTFDQEVMAYTWQSADTAIIATDSGDLWYWSQDNKTRPVQFVSSVGVINPIDLLYSNLNKQLYLYDGSRVISFEVE
ncbi:MAG: PEGA domain-containing protein [Patescibacteria group bacterium]|nr:PEGA domain-containing protein [Patescibacteria group bacterium]